MSFADGEKSEKRRFLLDFAGIYRYHDKKWTELVPAGSRMNRKEEAV